MYKYELVRVIAILKNTQHWEFTEHREIIEKYASDGWRYVGYIPADVSNSGGAVNKIDLIFEKEEVQE